MGLPAVPSSKNSTVHSTNWPMAGVQERKLRTRLVELAETLDCIISCWTHEHILKLRKQRKPCLHSQK